MITVRFACGHAESVDVKVVDTPVCWCGERRVSHVDAPRPRFRGVAQGPCAEYEDLPAQPVPMKETR